MAPKSGILNRAQVSGDNDAAADGRLNTQGDNSSGENNNKNDAAPVERQQQQVADKPPVSSADSQTGGHLRKLPKSGAKSREPVAAVVEMAEAHQTHSEHHTKHTHHLVNHEQSESSEQDHLKEEKQKEAVKAEPLSQNLRADDVKPIAEPLIANKEHQPHHYHHHSHQQQQQQHHHHRLPIGGQMNDSRERIESLRAQGELSSYPIELTYSDRLVGYAFLFGLPLFASVIVMLLFLMIFKHCRRYGQESKQYGGKSKSKSSKQRTSSSSEKQPVEGKNTPIGFISGGKVMNGLKGISIIGGVGSGGGKGKSSDSKQLTLNMEPINEDGDSYTAPSSGRMKIFNASQKIKYYGKLQYRMSYDFNESIFSVTILRAENLPAMDLNGYSDPYVKVYLTPEKRNYYKTRIHRKSLNPIFDESFQFRIAYSTLMSQTLVMAVYDYDRFSKHDEIGQVAVPISSVDLAQMYENWTELKRIVDSDNGQVSSSGGNLAFTQLAEPKGQRQYCEQ